jgi:hypothetical protein
VDFILLVFRGRGLRQGIIGPLCMSLRAGLPQWSWCLLDQREVGEEMDSVLVGVADSGVEVLDGIVQIGGEGGRILVRSPLLAGWRIRAVVSRIQMIKHLEFKG